MDTAVDDYNYAHFDKYVAAGGERREFSAFPNQLHVGQPAPDFSALRLDDNETVTLSEVSRRRAVLLEFGSFT